MQGVWWVDVSVAATLLLEGGDELSWWLLICCLSETKSRTGSRGGLGNALIHLFFLQLPPLSPSRFHLFRSNVHSPHAVILYIYTSILHRYSLCPQQTHINVLTYNPMLTTPDNLLLHNSSLYSINSKSRHWTLKHSCTKNQILPMPLELYIYTAQQNWW